MIISAAEHVDGPVALELPKQRAAIDDAVSPALKLRMGQGFHQRARQRQMHPSDILRIRQRPRNPVHREQNFLGLPFIVRQQMREIAMRLMQV